MSWVNIWNNQSNITDETITVFFTLAEFTNRLFSAGKRSSGKSEFCLDNI